VPLTDVLRYFSRYALEEVYLKDPAFAKYINKDVLEKYYPVGGVRIEDDILVTKDGYENLSTAPKGEEACAIIREQRSHGSGRGHSWKSQG
jgi:Xaa-Pro dipeptidase